MFLDVGVLKDLVEIYLMRSMPNSRKFLMQRLNGTGIMILSIANLVKRGQKPGYTLMYVPSGQLFSISLPIQMLNLEQEFIIKTMMMNGK
tara:strand:+ start:7652 stop:7921 length:270 start_codon:yes stop_codon:yes gene_type:complete